MNQNVQDYIESLILTRSELVTEMEKYAANHNIPIMELAGIETMLQMLRIQQPKRILEIGTAIGYSAIRMVEAVPQLEVITIERDFERLEKAKKNLSRFHNSSRIKVIHGDALEVVEKIEAYGPYDALFIDAAKGQYQKFFELYTPFLSKKGVVYSDNVLFKGMVAEEEIDNKRISKMVNKLKDYNQWLMNHKDFQTAILPVGDGLAVSKKRGVSFE
ncbi:putative O-methyltransferase YrrM [Bacillus pakistanensis]|uniref:tRNA 5-hydroxyuridine methyltransferase n=1 Tax=Rossellomorea pakistanensis TaxID=992288 RepID=A0ABS2NA99_9BACI|nr:O-methyltransferase [Bacillus pakistanensis]MBM7584778.1 putative O-methyltransferase YrrM [Bacillus pakistanensis]